MLKPISAEVENKLKIATRDLEKPYQLKWLNDIIGTRVKKQALVFYSMEGFQDKR